MPEVNGKKYPYTKEGVARAKEHADVTGKELSMDYPSYDAGGRVEKYATGGKLPANEGAIEEHGDITREVDRVFESESKVTEIIKRLKESGIYPKKDEPQDTPKTEGDDVGPVDFDPDDTMYEDIA